MATTIKGVVGGGLTISASPATEIVIPTGYLLNEDDYGDNITRSIIIPNGVHVIRVHAVARNEDSSTDEQVYMSIYSDNKTWYTDAQDGYVTFVGYIGVTPNKQYNVTLDIIAVSSSYRLQIEYSPEINKQTPTVTDY